MPMGKSSMGHPGGPTTTETKMRSLLVVMGWPNMMMGQELLGPNCPGVVDDPAPSSYVGVVNS